MTKGKKRDSRFELLRIITMLMIIVHHLIVHGVFKSGMIKDGLPGTHPFALYKLIAMGGKPAVILFILISGYFQINVELNIKNIVKLWLQVLFYSVGIAYILIFFNLIPNNTPLMQYWFPVSTVRYGFFTDYFKLILLSPFIKIMIKSLKEKQLLYLIIIGIVMGYIVPTAFFQENQREFTSYFFRFVIIFIIGAYLKIYGHERFIKNKKIIILFLLSLPVLFLNFTQIISEFQKLNVKNSSAFLNFGYINLIIALLIFILFCSLPSFSNNLINFVSKQVFGVYLFHDHILMRKVLWFNLFDVRKFIGHGSLNFIVQSAKAVLLIFIIGSVIDYVREKIFVVIYKTEIVITNLTRKTTKD
ncbi:hypothetical protein BG261_07225 [Floricoccus tropicus]|uniref:Acyltransferase 3 domain-containing protein n=1 Tax=Floricoccus tropicus TaxID=1859473 RepID=A0A1E8GKG1_9LACT|nr:acyltransferase family protein [Floricoccus tropicus]OFI48677.1 hypothetical protein BG261_07225 [Floricoccus tropicus]